jgi:hypothetical protein
MTAEARAFVERMVGWFLATHQDPLESMPYDGREGGYQYLFGGPYDARLELISHFGAKLAALFSDDDLEAILDAAVSEIGEDGCLDWAGESDADDIPTPHVPALRADAHQWGPGHIHRFDEERGKTFCGRSLAACPGRRSLAFEEEINCKACQRASRAAAERMRMRGEREEEATAEQRFVVVKEAGEILLLERNRGRIVSRAELSRAHPRLFAQLVRSDHKNAPRVVRERRR